MGRQLSFEVNQVGEPLYREVVFATPLSRGGIRNPSIERWYSQPLYREVVFATPLKIKKNLE
jgi:hypothetical protein